MLASVLLNLIDNYNEDGFLILSSNLIDIYWCNGKRMELFIRSNIELSTILFLNKKLYAKDFDNNVLQIFKNKKFVDYNIQNVSILSSLGFFNQTNFIKGRIALCDSYIYYDSFFKFEKTKDLKNWINLKYKKDKNGGYILKSYRKCLYYFAHGQNEIYDTIKEQWFNFASNISKKPNINNIYLFKNQFYICYENHFVFKYDPQLDKWFETKLKIDAFWLSK